MVIDSSAGCRRKIFYPTSFSPDVTAAVCQRYLYTGPATKGRVWLETRPTTSRWQEAPLAVWWRSAGGSHPSWGLLLLTGCSFSSLNSTGRAFGHVPSQLLSFTFCHCLRGQGHPGFAFPSSALLSKQAAPCLLRTPPPHAGCLSVICRSASQANICSVVPDATSLLFAQVLTSAPSTSHSPHPYTPRFSNMHDIAGVQASLSHPPMHVPCWQARRKKRQPRDAQPAKPTCSLAASAALSGRMLMTSSTAVSPCHFPKATMSHTHPVPHPKKLKGAKGKHWGSSPHKSSPGACAREPTWLLSAHDPQV